MKKKLNFRQGLPNMKLFLIDIAKCPYVQDEKENDKYQLGHHFVRSQERWVENGRSSSHVV